MKQIGIVSVRLVFRLLRPNLGILDPKRQVLPVPIYFSLLFPLFVRRMSSDSKATGYDGGFFPAPAFLIEGAPPSLILRQDAPRLTDWPAVCWPAPLDNTGSRFLEGSNQEATHFTTEPLIDSCALLLSPRGVEHFFSTVKIRAHPITSGLPLLL